VEGRDVAAVAVLSSLVISSDFALAPYSNMKLMDLAVFMGAYVFGFRVGASVAVITETLWSFLSPFGFAGAVAPFLVAGEILFAAAGALAARAWKPGGLGIGSKSLFIGALMLVCAFAWDLETNAATALIVFWPAISLRELLATEVLGIPFAIPHEEADFLLGLLVAPASAALVPRMARGKRA
jgi:hypothetical protein